MDFSNLKLQPISLQMVFAGAVMGFMGIGLGAFGAHGLSDVLAAFGHQPTWQTAVLYQFIHALALVMVAVWPSILQTRSRLWTWVLWSWVFGVLLFSGSLYTLSLGGPQWLGPVTPIGGLLLMVGWGCVAVWGLGCGVLRSSDKRVERI